MSVGQKIVDIMKEVKFIAKDGKISFGNTKYNFIADDDVIRIIRERMTASSLIMYPIKAESRVTEFGGKFLTVTEQTFRILDTEDGDFIDVSTAGQGADSADKGSGKSMTNARKYALLQTFMLTGDDPDDVPSDSYRTASTGAGNSKPPTAPPPVHTDDGRVLIAFGKHKGKYLDDVLKTDDGKQWAGWYLANGNDATLKASIEEALSA